MERSVFEQMGGTYHKQGDFFLPDLAVPESKKLSIGVWSLRHLRYIREQHRGLYVGLQLSGKLDSYLADIDRQAEDIFFQLVKQTADCEEITEHLKATNQLEWVRKMNNIRNRATEIVESDLIYT